MINKQSPNSNHQTISKFLITKPKFDLEKRTLDFSMKVIMVCGKLVRNPVNDVLVRQLVRAAGSIGANYREANDVFSKKDFRYKIGISLMEAKEAHYWLNLLREANINYKEIIWQLIGESCELRKIFSSIVSKSY